MCSYQHVILDKLWLQWNLEVNPSASAALLPPQSVASRPDHHNHRDISCLPLTHPSQTTRAQLLASRHSSPPYSYFSQHLFNPTAKMSAEIAALEADRKQYQEQVRAIPPEPSQTSAC